METALRVALVIALAAFLLWVAKYLNENPVEQEIDRLSAEVQRLDDANDELRQRNDRYRTLVRGLREDPRVLDRRARETLGMSRDREVIIYFNDEQDAASRPR